MNQETNKEWQKVLMVTLLAGMAWGPHYFTFLRVQLK